MVSVTPAPDGAIDINIFGDTSGFVTSEPPNDASGTLDATVEPPNDSWTPLFNRWEISDDPAIGTASIDANTGEWTYTVDPAEFDDLDNGEIALDAFEVTFTAFVFNPGGQLQFETETQTIDIVVEGVCFVLGTLIDTPRGPVAIENLRVGDLVHTKDNGAQPIRWIESSETSVRRMKEKPNLYPVRVKAGALGRGMPRRDLFVSQQHRLLVSGPAVQVLLGEREALVAAKSLCNWPGIDIIEPDGPVHYYHALLDRHEILDAEGAPAESLYLGEEAIVGMSSEGLQELADIFDRAQINSLDEFGGPSCLILRDFEAQLLTPA